MVVEICPETLAETSCGVWELGITASTLAGCGTEQPPPVA